MKENKIFQLMEKMYVEMQNGFTQVNKKIDKNYSLHDIAIK